MWEADHGLLAKHGEKERGVEKGVGETWVGQ